MQSYMATWLGWKTGTVSDGEIIARMHVDPFFKRWFEERRSTLFNDRTRHTAPQTGT